MANDMVDLHGLEAPQAYLVLQRHRPQIQALETALMTELLSMSQGHPPSRRYQDLATQKQRLLQAIQREGNYGFTDLQTVYYFKNDIIYTTLEVIDSPRSDRMRFLSNPPHPLWTTFKIWRNSLYRACFHNHDLIAQMQQYELLVTQLSLGNALEQYSSDCPAYHCLTSFQHPSLQPYWDIFQQGVATEKSRILATLRDDPDPKRRASAAFLVGHFQDPEEIVTVLSAYINDPSSLVRNNTLRVIAMTLFKAHLKEVDSMPFIHLLASPFVTDRNKALGILLALADNEQARKQIIRYGGQQILALLHLTQPDNHDFAYALLKKMSKQDFGERYYSQWQSWLTQEQGHAHAFR